MTRRLELTAAEWAAVQAGGWLVMAEPAELVAAAVPCETCGGDRLVLFDQDELVAPCLDCRITLLGECPGCDGAGRQDVIPGAVYERCPECRGRKTVTLGHAYAVSDVLHAPTSWPHLPDEQRAALLRDAGCTCSYVLHGWRPSAGPRCRMCGTVANLVGQYALQLDVVR